MEMMYYDERYYLSRFGTTERKLLEYWKERNKSDNEKEEEMYSSLISAYDSYIKLAGILINEISIDNSISKGVLISLLLQAGAFSYDEFKYGNVDDILNTRLGLNVITGEACCRNVSNFMTDIFKSNGEYCENLTVTALNKKDKRKATREIANHMMNLISYNGILYGFDIFDSFGTLYYFLNEFELLPIDSKEHSFMYYKPYLDYVYNNLTFEDLKNRLLLFKSNGKNIITQSEFKEIVSETDEKLTKDISLVQDFIKDTNGQLIDIKEKIKLMKR